VRLKRPTPPGWTEAVLADFETFLLDHAGCERKASASALAFVAHYPDRRNLVEACLGLAREELGHFEAVWRLLDARGRTLRADTRSLYMDRLAKEFRQGSEPYFLDRLLAAGIAEARGCERFGLVAASLPDGPERDFYREIARAEVRHQELYLDLAREYFPRDEVEARLETLLSAEARIVEELPIRAALYA
jgi:tRNA 2-(methylsulfanyl)-N6-isopentenyladenosine37 hydroxylase